MVDCKPSSRIEAVLNMAVKVKDAYEAVNILNERVKRRVLIKCSKNDASNVWYHLRRDGSQQILFLANLSRTQEVRLRTRFTR
jgi:molybdopterin synthase catalytic subunit